MKNIITLEDLQKIKWFLKVKKAKTYYPTSVFEQFYIKYGNEFAGGYSFFCNKCNKIASYIREDYFDIFDSQIVVHIICYNCGAIFKIEKLKHIYQRIFEDQEI